MMPSDPDDGILPASAREDFEASRRAVAAWERAHPVDIAGILDWIDQLRSVFGDPPVDRRPWRGDDYRL